ncbi:rod shape-determining protein MreD [Psychrobacter sp. P2G3]|uniref:rod shape-determining protein MreD n=1 Tax=Psychrobacter sp. P2G3 TaxID=1699622 RepID=UPI00078D5E49|nr:rod shape-determining protein MreD [Psychrobacter sp. P2G3]AMN48965.1 rod shape-determining protein MreD [Psychrobacter sp. P2G3]
MALSNSEHSPSKMLLAIILSFVVASSPNVYPLSPTMATLRPMIMIMVLIFWLLFQPRYVGIFTAFTVGIAADLLMDTHLGQQAFAAVVMVLALRVCSIQIKQLNTLSAWFLAAVGLIVFQLSLWVLQLMTQNLFVAQSGLSLLMSILSWPIILLILRGFTR